MGSKLFILISLCITLGSCDQGYTYSIGYTTVIPDSLRDDRAEWIQKVVSSTNFHMTTSDYEDPEDVIEAAEQTSYRLYSVQIPCLIRSKERAEFVLQESMTREERHIFDSLMTR